MAAAAFRPLRSIAPLRNARIAAPHIAPRLATRQVALRTYAAPAAASAPPPTPGAAPNASGGGGGSSTAVIGLLVAIAAGAGGYYFLADDAQKQALFSKAGSLTSSSSSNEHFPNGVARGPEEYQKVYNAVADLLESESYEDGHYGPVLVRLGWHASGTYDKETGGGGSNGATMRFAPESNHGANAGLLAARDLLEKVHQKFPWITYSDLWTLSAVAAIQEMGGPTIPWRPGRRDGLEANCTPDGRLPDGDKGPDHLRFIFNRMGFGDQEIVALSGAHALGRCHSDRSGFEGPWTFAPTSFTNEYYNLLLNEKWQFKKWKGPIQYEDKSTKSLMMLTTDMALVQDKSFRPHVERYAKDEQVFFDEFAQVFKKLVELGVPQENWKPWENKSGGKAYELKTTAEQENAK